MPYVQPPRNYFDIDAINLIVRKQSRRYHIQARSLRREQRRYQFSDDIYHFLLKEIRTEVFTNLHAGLRGLYSAGTTRKWFKHLCKVIVNERSHSFNAGDPLPGRYIIGIVEGLWDMFNTESLSMYPHDEL